MINVALSGSDMILAYAEIEKEWNESEFISFQTSGSTGTPKVKTFTNTKTILSFLTKTNENFHPQTLMLMGKH